MAADKQDHSLVDSSVINDLFPFKFHFLIKLLLMKVNVYIF